MGACKAVPSLCHADAAGYEQVSSMDRYGVSMELSFISTNQGYGMDSLSQPLPTVLVTFFCMAAGDFCSIPMQGLLGAPCSTLI